jgi:chemotaxis methyl-accepting protein methylase
MACGLSPDRITHYFQAAGSQWRVKDELRALVNFRKLNLLARIFHKKGQTSSKSLIE